MTCVLHKGNSWQPLRFIVWETEWHGKALAARRVERPVTGQDTLYVPHMYTPHMHTDEHTQGKQPGDGFENMFIFLFFKSVFSQHMYFFLLIRKNVGKVPV